MPKFKIIRKNGKRYIKIGQKRVKVHRSMTERELLQWLVKHFTRRRRPKKKEKGDLILPTPKVSVTYSTAPADDTRIQIRNLQNKLDESEKKLKEEVKQLMPPQRPALPPAERPALMSPVRPSTTFRLPSTFETPKPPPKLEEEEEEAASSAPRPKPPRKSLPVYTQGQADAKLQQVSAAVAEVEKLQEELKAAEIRRRAMAAAKFESRLLGFTKKELTELTHNNWKIIEKNKISKADLIDEYKTQLGKDEIEKAIKEIEDDMDKENSQIADINAAIKKAEEAKKEAMKGRGRDESSKGLSEDEINEAMKGHKQFLGTIAANEIRNLKHGTRKRICWIMNTDPRSKPGKHWVAVLIDARPHGSHSVEYYDPLADPMPQKWLDDIKILLRQMGIDHYLRFKFNTVADQSDDSSNCGPFCIHFLQSRLAGESFGQASGWNEAGERMIEKWKSLQTGSGQSTPRKAIEFSTMRPAPKLWVSGQHGEGLRDIFDKVRKGATKIYERIRATLGGPRAGPSPAVRAWLEKYGDLRINRIWVCKKPVQSWIEKIGNFVTNGKLRAEMDKQGYENFMHLYSIVALKGGPTVRIEKNQIVEIKQSTDRGKQYKDVQVEPGRTVRGLLEAAEKRVGADRLWIYHLATANCQKFQLWFLGSMITPELHEFIEQDVESTLKDMGLLQKVATAVTDIAATADVAMNGAGFTTMPVHHMKK